MKYTPQLFLSILFLTSCQAVYVPNVRNTPLFSGKGEAQGSFAFGVNGLDLQAAAAVTDHLAVMANYATLDRGTDALDNKTSASYYEGGFGYYHNYRITCFEIFGGYGKGSGVTESKDDSGLGSPHPPGGPVTANYDKIFVQPSFGWNKRRFHFSISCRLSSVNFTQFSDRGIVQVVPTTFYIEPAATGRINFLDNRLFGFTQVGLNASTHAFDESTLNETSDRYYRNLNMCLGMGFRLGGKHTRAVGQK